jgi:hypothetical protein
MYLFAKVGIVDVFRSLHLGQGRRSIHSAAESIRLGYAGWAMAAAGLRLAGPRGGVLDAAVGVSTAKLDKLKAGPVANHGLLI